MTRGGKREGAGRPPAPNSKKTKNRTFKLYDWEVEKVKEFIKQLRKNGNCQESKLTNIKNIIETIIRVDNMNYDDALFDEFKKILNYCK